MTRSRSYKFYKLEIFLQYLVEIIKFDYFRRKNINLTKINFFCMILKFFCLFSWNHCKFYILFQNLIISNFFFVCIVSAWIFRDREVRQLCCFGYKFVQKQSFSFFPFFVAWGNKFLMNVTKFCFVCQLSIEEVPFPGWSQVEKNICCLLFENQIFNRKEYHREKELRK